MRERISRPSPAMVVACLALAVALSGVGYAATTLPRSSVGPVQLRANAVTSAKVKDGSLRPVDFASRQLLQGAPGPAGPAGEAGAKGEKGERGPKGDPGVSGFEVRASFTKSELPTETVVTTCPAGKTALYGHPAVLSPVYTYVVVRSEPAPAGWLVEVMINDSDPGPWSLTAFAFCVNKNP